MSSVGTIVVAYAKSNRVIGRAGRLPWDLPAERRHFFETTRGGTVVVGRATWDSLPRRPLPDRANVIVGHRKFIQEEPGPAFMAGSLDLAEWLARSWGDPLYWIGGESVYRQVLDRGLADRIIASEIPGDYEGDVFFPPLGPEWREVEREAREGFEVVEFGRHSS